jgi:hypothetical protein
MALHKSAGRMPALPSIGAEGFHYVDAGGA